MRVRVPAKVNLFLAVRGRRPDGYHELVSILQTVSLHDELEVVVPAGLSEAHPSARRGLALTVVRADGSSATELVTEDNLAVRAARALMAELGLGGGELAPAGAASSSTTTLALTKRIPVAAGMAGGSADAAAALVALDRAWDAALGRERLLALAAGLGADVPFCVVGGTALATGTGTATAQVLARGRFHWVVGIDDAPLATADVYRAHDEVGAPSLVEPDVVLQALRTGDVDLLGAALHNDLQAAADHLRPGLVAGRAALLDAGAVAALVSGSGPTLLGLARDEEHARAVAEAVRERFARVEVVASPAGGPELLAA